MGWKKLVGLLRKERNLASYECFAQCIKLSVRKSLLTLLGTELRGLFRVRRSRSRRRGFFRRDGNSEERGVALRSGRRDSASAASRPATTATSST